MDRIIRRAFRGHTEMRLLFGELSGKIGGIKGGVELFEIEGEEDLCLVFGLVVLNRSKDFSIKRIVQRRKKDYRNDSFLEKRKIIEISCLAKPSRLRYLLRQISFSALFF